MIVTLATVLSIISLNVVTADRFDYAGYRVVRVTPQSTEHLSSIRQFQDKWTSLDFWRSPTKVDVPVDIFIGPEEYAALDQQITSLNLSPTVIIQDVQSLIDSSEAVDRAKASNWTENFHTYEEIVTYIQEVESQNGLLRTSIIGNSYENNSIYMTTISSGNSTSKGVIYLECCMHAREWISTATCMFIIEELVTKYGNDSGITQLVDTYDWLITPISNPDGYIYSWTNNRLWRKNRRPIDNSTCTGVDSNRNFDANFGGIGSDTNPCSETYSGPSAFSEAESRAMRDVLLAHSGRVKAAVSIHSNAQLWISPYGYTTERPADYAEMERIMKVGVAALSTPYGTRYPYGPGSEVLYFTSGTTKDYVYDTLGIIHGYTLELRNSPFGFVPPASDIIPVATEAWNGLKAMAFAISAA